MFRKVDNIQYSVRESCGFHWPMPPTHRTYSRGKQEDETRYLETGYHSCQRRRFIGLTEGMDRLHRSDWLGLRELDLRGGRSPGPQCSIFSQVLNLIPRAGSMRRCASTKLSATPRDSPAGASRWPCCSASWDRDVSVALADSRSLIRQVLHHHAISQGAVHRAPRYPRISTVLFLPETSSADPIGG